MTIDLLKQTAIPWAYKYQPPGSVITYDATYTCAMDTTLQMVFFLWFRGFVPHSVVEKDSLLLQTMIRIRDKNYDQARHKLQVQKQIRPKTSHIDGNRDVWDCWGDHRDYRPFPVLFASNGPIYMTWENCSKKGEGCPFHDNYVRLSTRHSNLRKKCLYFVTDPTQNKTIQEIIDERYGTSQKSCRRHIYDWVDKSKGDKKESEPEVNDKHTAGQGDTSRCPYDGIRKSYCVATFNSCPWVMVVGGSFDHYNFHTLNDIPKSVIFPPETQYSLACIILRGGQHFRGMSVDSRNSPGVHLIFDGINVPEDMIQIVSLDDPFSKFAPRHDIMELWYVKVDSGSSSAGTEMSSLIIPPMASANDMDIHRFAEQKQLPQRDTGQSALQTEDKSVNLKQSSPNTHVSEQKQSLLLKSLTTKEMYLKAIQEMYPEANMGLLSSNLAIYEDWDNVRAVAALKAFTAVRKMITEKTLVYDNRTSLSDDEDSDGSCASYMQKKPKKTNLDDEDKKFFTSLPTCYSLFFAFDSKDAAHSYCPFSSHNKCWQSKNSLETVLDGYECRNRPFKSNELQQHVAQTHSKSWCGVGLRIFLHELYPCPLTADKGFASKTSNTKKIKSKNNPFATHASSHFL